MESTILLALLVLTILFIAFWMILTPEDEEASYYKGALIGTKGGKSKKDTRENDDAIIEDDLI